MKGLQILVFTVMASFGFSNCKGQTFNLRDYNSCQNYLCQGKWCFDTTTVYNWYETFRAKDSYWLFKEVKFSTNGTCTLKKSSKKPIFKKDTISGRMVNSRRDVYQDTVISGTWKMDKKLVEDGDQIARTITIYSKYNFGGLYKKKDTISFIYMKGGTIDNTALPNKPIVLSGYAFGIDFYSTEEGKLSAYLRK